MEIVNVNKAKIHLSSLIDSVLKGENIIIAKNGNPVVVLEKFRKVNGKSCREITW